MVDWTRIKWKIFTENILEEDKDDAPLLRIDIIKYTWKIEDNNLSTSSISYQWDYDER